MVSEGLTRLYVVERAMSCCVVVDKTPNMAIPGALKVTVMSVMCWLFRKD